MIDAGCWMVDVGLEKIKNHRYINVGWWMLDDGRMMLDDGFWIRKD